MLFFFSVCCDRRRGITDMFFMLLVLASIVLYLPNERRVVDTDTGYVLVLYHTVAIMRYSVAIMRHSTVQCPYMRILCEQLTFPSQSSKVAPTDTVLPVVVVEHYDSLAYF
ncbi:hypothetical protein B9Z19DRAFT_1088416 [Tuber borchii]|uniref:Uncharacterized protein n=1 Tax=Tuber borchii TaxID=42251 RepID=A0A2T6ZLH9_TUBBO|nr:hypothetical protein B9Z19DRAFT_1088416 [Tuber borchii]